MKGINRKSRRYILPGEVKKCQKYTNQRDDIIRQANRQQKYTNQTVKHNYTNSRNILRQLNIIRQVNRQQKYTQTFKHNYTGKQIAEIYLVKHNQTGKQTVEIYLDSET